MSAEPDFQSFNKMFRNVTLWMLAFSPLYAVFQGILFAFMQSAWTLTYIRLTHKTDGGNISAPIDVDPVQPEDNDKTFIATQPHA